MAFQAEVGQELAIDGLRYRITEHPAAPGMPYGQEGQQAVVYQLRTETDCRALKVFKPRFRLPALVAVADQLRKYASLPGLAVCQRVVLTPQHHTALLKPYPDLTYAVVMPWIEGSTWMELLLEKRALAPEQSLTLAQLLADILAAMEQHGLAHCDLSGPNLLLSGLVGGTGVALVDMEQMYGPELRRPELLPGGSPGYAHRTAPEGLWGPNADRFAGVVLLAEMLGWCDERVREAAWGESYFEPAEMQLDSDRFRLLMQVLGKHWGTSIAALFERAWRSETLADCATFGEWLVTLPEEVPTLETGREIAITTGETRTPAVAESAAATADAVRALMELAREFEEQGNLASTLATYRRAQSLALPGSGLEQELALIVRGWEVKSRSPSPTADLATSPAPEVKGGAEAQEVEKRSYRDVAHLFDEGLTAYEHGEWARAKELLSEVVRQSPDYNRGTHRADELLARIDPHLGDRQQHAAVTNHRKRNRAIGLLSLLLVGSVCIAVMWSLGRDGRGPLAPVLATPTPTPPPVPVIAGIPEVPAIPISVENSDQIRTLYEIKGHDNINTITFSPDGQVLVSGGGFRDYMIRAWRVSDGTLLWTEIEKPYDVRDMAFTPDGAWLAVTRARWNEGSGGGASGGSDVIEIRDVVSGNLLRTIESPFGDYLAFSPNGLLLASSLPKVWRVSSGDITIPYFDDSCRSGVSFRPDGNSLIAGDCDDHTAKVWDISGGLIATMGGTPYWVFDLALSPDGSLLATACGTGSSDSCCDAGGVVQIWRISDGTLLYTLKGHTDSVNSVSFSPDGQILASGSSDDIRLWQVTDGTLLGALDGGANTVAFSPDGRVLASGSSDGTIRIWGVK